MSGNFAINNTQVAGQSEALVGYTKQIANMIDQLDSQVQRVIQQWTGEARDQYYQRHHQWVQKVQDMGQLLQLSSTVLQELNQGYQITDNRLAQDWTPGR